MGKKEKSNPPTNKWDFSINLTNKLYNLVNSGKIIGIVVITLLGYLFYVTSKVPDNEVAHLILAVLEFLKNCGFYFIPLSITNITLIVGIIIQKKIYTKEIKRMAKFRKKVIHGIETGELQMIQKHSSSNFDFD